MVWFVSFSRKDHGFSLRWVKGNKPRMGPVQDGIEVLIDDGGRVSRIVNYDIHTGVIRKALDIRVYVRDDVVNIK